MGLLSRASILLLASCTSDVAVDLAVIDGPRLLAVAATPAEGAPDAQVRLRALWVDEHGARPDDDLSWALCLVRRPLAELGPIADACIDDLDDTRMDLGRGTVAIATIPDDACRLFGPDPPPAQPGMSQARPVDPDRTGGYYQPLIVESREEIAGFGVRIDCGTAGATQQQSAELRMRHRDNVSPYIGALAIAGATSTSSAADRVVTVEAGAELELTAGWRACAVDERCDGAERYPRFDPVSLEIVESREALSLAWYATAGDFDTNRTGRSDRDEARTSANVWTAPDEVGRVTLWIVIRDDRGGTSWRTIFVDVQ
ncbi:MAG TPA: hypothetical protein VG755_16020 [Nannocystaceae bacterium]|nr:hypothetical protein [Nannocystaceae bacterium]